MTVVTDEGAPGILAAMNSFGSVREAKEYLIGKILAQADRDGIQLSDVERKMLYFTETGWTLPDMMAVSREFDQKYDQAEYESKIGTIVRRACGQPEGDRESWDEAVRRLKDEDHYLSVLIDGGERERSSGWVAVKAVLGGVVLAAVFLPGSFFVYGHIENRALADGVVSVALLVLVFLAAFIASRGRKRAA